MGEIQWGDLSPLFGPRFKSGPVTEALAQPPAGPLRGVWGGGGGTQYMNQNDPHAADHFDVCIMGSWGKFLCQKFSGRATCGAISRHC